MLFRLKKAFNKKGVTLIELLVVIAIMGIMGVAIGMFMSSSIKIYGTETKYVIAKDISAAIEKEVERLTLNATEIYLQNQQFESGNFSDIGSKTLKVRKDDGSFVDIEMTNAPSEAAKANALYTNNKKNGDAGSSAQGYFYFGDTKMMGITEADNKAFYSDMTVKLIYRVIKNNNGLFKTFVVYAHVYEGTKIIYESPGRTISPLYIAQYTEKTLLSYSVTSAYGKEAYKADFATNTGVYGNQLQDEYANSYVYYDVLYFS